MIKVFEAFSGIGTQRMALKRLGIEHEVVAIAEIDKYAIKTYEAIHGLVNNLGDISKIDTNDIPDHDLFTYSFPCQDISVAGKQAGIKEGTRSGLLYECEKVIATKKPKYLLLENVKNLVGKKHKADFDNWLSWLELQGYTNYWQVLNAKNYGVPQNRERVFCISVLGKHETYNFPQGFELEKRLKDVLEKKVDEKFYLSNEQVNKINLSSFMQESRRIQEKDYCDTLLSRDYKSPKCVRIGGIFDTEERQRQAGVIYDKEQLSPTLTTMEGGWRQPSILIENATKKGYLEATEGDEIDLAYPTSETRRGRVQKETSHTLTTSDNLGTLDRGYRIRKLTPLECWRLMGIDDEDFYKAQEVNSNSQLYKQAGNAIVVDVLCCIFKELFKSQVGSITHNEVA